MLSLPPLLWAGNASVGRLCSDLISPFALNLLRWGIAFVVLLPLAWKVLRKDSPIWPLWRRYMLLGLLGIGCYNALLYLALKTSTPLNVTLVSSSMPVWMLAIGRLCWGISVSRRQLCGALLSILGVIVVMSHGDLQSLITFLRIEPFSAWKTMTLSHAGQRKRTAARSWSARASSISCEASPKCAFSCGTTRSRMTTSTQMAIAP